VYGGMQEKVLTLDIAKRLQALLVANGYGVVMTRTTDKALSNSERASICDKGQVDSVLSVHLNASTDPSADYFTALYGKPTKDRTFAQAVWDNYELSDADGVGSLPKSGISQFASGLLLKSNAPATIAETIFLSNPAEQSLLSDGTGGRQQAIAEALYQSLAAWYDRSS
jgi:N-acetylmuramoyl-L-alanine amidase